MLRQTSWPREGLRRTGTTLGRPDQAIASEWQEKLDKLSPEQRQKFHSGSRSSPDACIAQIQGAIDHSRMTKILNIFKPIFNTLNIYAPIVTAGAQVDPTPTSLILGGITCILSATTSMLDYQDKVLGMLSKMSEELEILKEFEGLYAADKEVQAAILRVETDILDFVAGASHVFLDKEGNPKNSAKLFIQAMWRPFEAKFGDIQSNFESHLGYFHKRKAVADGRDAAAGRKMLRDVHDRQDDLIQEMRDGFSGQARREEEQKKTALSMEARKARQEAKRRALTRIPSRPFGAVQEEKMHRLIKGTGEWLLHNDLFTSWKSSSGSQLLLVQGKHGSGKSHLAALTIDTLQNALQQGDANATNITGLAFVYCGHLRTSSQVDAAQDRGQVGTAPGQRVVLGSILRQLYGQLPDDVEFPGEGERVLSRWEEEQPGTEQIKTLLREIVTHFKQAFIVIDGLDECHTFPDYEFEELCSFVAVLADESTTNVIVFSRPDYLDVTTALGRFPTIMVDGGLNEDDIHRYIVKNIRDHPRSNMLAEVQSDLVDRADGMFLWVALVLPLLRNQRSVKKMREVLERAPREIERLYEKSLERMLSHEETRSEAIRVLILVSNAPEPLTQAEILHYLATDPGMKELDQESILSDGSGLSAECADLITLHGDRYYLIHASLATFLHERLSTCQSPLVEEYRQEQESAHETIATLCLTYLGFSTFSVFPGSLEEFGRIERDFPFFSYAAIRVGYHVRKAGQLRLKDSMIAFLSSPAAQLAAAMVWRHSFSGYTLGVSPEDLTISGPDTLPLHLVCIYHLPDIFDDVPHSPKEITHVNRYGATPLDCALDMGSSLASRILHEAKQHVDQGTLAKVPLLVNIVNPMLGMAARKMHALLPCLLDLQYNINFLGLYGTAVHVAATNGSFETLEALLKAGADPNKSKLGQDSPIISAARYQSWDCVQCLLSFGARIQAQGRDGRTLLHFAVAQNRSDMVEYLLDKEPALLDVKDRATVNGVDRPDRTPLHVAVMNRLPDMIRLLVKLGSKSLEEPDCYGLTPLLVACQDAGGVECFNVLVHELDVDRLAVSPAGESALHVCAWNNTVTLLYAVLDLENGPLTSSRNNNGYTPLHIAAYEGHGDIACGLLDHGADANALSVRGKQSAVHHCIINGHASLAETMILKYKARTDIIPTAGDNLVGVAASVGMTSILPTLLSLGLDPEMPDADGFTPLARATAAGYLEFACALCDSCPQVSLAHQTAAGLTPLHYAAEYGFHELASYLTTRDPSLCQLRSNDGRDALPLHLAVGGGNLQCVRILAQLSDLEQLDADECTALMVSCWRREDDFDIVEYLVKEAGADVNASNKFEETPLTQSLHRGSADCSHLLLDNGANPFIGFYKGQNSLELAAKWGYVSLVERLLDPYRNQSQTWSLDDIFNGFLAAMESKSHGTISRFCSSVQLDLLLEKGDSELNGTPIAHLALQSGNAALVQAIVSRRHSSIFQLNDAGWDALSIAVGQDRLDLVKFLVEAGVPVDGIAGQTFTPLAVAALQGTPEIVEYLIQSGARANSKLLIDGVSTPLSFTTVVSGSSRAVRFGRTSAHMVLEGGADLSGLDPYGHFLAERIKTGATAYFPQPQGATLNTSPSKPGPRAAERLSDFAALILACNVSERSEELSAIDRNLAVEEILHCLLGISTEESLRYAQVVAGEFLHDIDPDDAACSICRTLWKHKWSFAYVCSTCASTICPDCHDDFVLGCGGQQRTCTATLADMEILRREDAMIRRAAFALRPLVHGPINEISCFFLLLKNATSATNFDITRKLWHPKNHFEEIRASFIGKGDKKSGSDDSIANTRLHEENFKGIHLISCLLEAFDMLGFDSEREGASRSRDELRTRPQKRAFSSLMKRIRHIYKGSRVGKDSVEPLCNHQTKVLRILEREDVASFSQHIDEDWRIDDEFFQNLMAKEWGIGNMGVHKQSGQGDEQQSSGPIDEITGAKLREFIRKSGSRFLISFRGIQQLTLAFSFLAAELVTTSHFPLNVGPDLDRDQDPLSSATFLRTLNSVWDFIKGLVLGDDIPHDLFRVEYVFQLFPGVVEQKARSPSGRGNLSLHGLWSRENGKWKSMAAERKIGQAIMERIGGNLYLGLDLDNLQTPRPVAGDELQDWSRIVGKWMAMQRERGKVGRSSPVEER